jgi:hypothetical protein
MENRPASPKMFCRGFSTPTEKSEAAPSGFESTSRVRYWWPTMSAYNLASDAGRENGGEINNLSALSAEGIACTCLTVIDSAFPS